MNLFQLAFIFAAVSPPALLAQTKFESAFVRFSGENRIDDMYAASAVTTQELVGEAGQGNLTQVTGSGTFIMSNAPRSDGVGQERVLERRGSLGVDQTFEKLSTAGVSYGYTGTKTLSRWYALRAGQWWNKATISTDFEYTKTDADVTSRSYEDTDGYRVVTPSRTLGDRYSLALTWLATTRAIFMASMATSMTSNRPTSNAATVEGRYFFDPTLTALHLIAGGYIDRGPVKKTTDYGRISAREWEAQIHQHLSYQIIGTVSLRNHYETEIPRSPDSTTIHRHSRATQARLRNRFVTGPVTDQVSELYIFTGQYHSVDADKNVNHIGLGGIYVL
jgi:hypothetical protein